MVQLSKSRARALFEGWALKKSFQGLLPPYSILFTSAVLKASMVTERTKEMCTPRLRWTPEQARQKKMPSLGEAWGKLIGLRTVALTGEGTYPLWGRRSAIYAFVVLVCFGEGEEFGACFWVDLPVLGAHVGGGGG